jgi:hypothetical protein
MPIIILANIYILLGHVNRTRGIALGIIIDPTSISLYMCHLTYN